MTSDITAICFIAAILAAILGLAVWIAVYSPPPVSAPKVQTYQKIRDQWEAYLYDYEQKHNLCNDRTSCCNRTP